VLPPYRAKNKKKIPLFLTYPRSSGNFWALEVNCHTDCLS